MRTSGHCLIQHGAKVEQVELSCRLLCPGVFLVQLLVCEIPVSERHSQHYTIRSAEECQHHGATFDVKSQSPDHYEFSTQVGTTPGPEVQAFVSMLYHYGF